MVILLRRNCITERMEKYQVINLLLDFLNLSGRVIRIIQKANEGQVVDGILIVDNSNNPWLIDQSNKYPPVYIIPQESNGAQSGDLVSAQVIPRY